MPSRDADNIAGDRVSCYVCQGRGYIIRKRKSWPHGTMARYTRLGCRCVYCKAANTIYWRARRGSAPTRIVFEGTKRAK